MERARGACLGCCCCYCCHWRDQERWRVGARRCFSEANWWLGWLQLRRLLRLLRVRWLGWAARQEAALPASTKRAGCPGGGHAWLAQSAPQCLQGASACLSPLLPSYPQPAAGLRQRGWLLGPRWLLADSGGRWFSRLQTSVPRRLHLARCGGLGRP
jgi:hypothetical protein